MSRVLNSLIISSDGAAQRALEEIMFHTLEGFVLSFLTLPLDKMHEIDRDPDLIFIDNKGQLTADEVHQVLKQFPKKTTVVLDDNSDGCRAFFRKGGVDEVMSLAELRSLLGRHLLEKLLAFKALADAETRIEESEERFRGIIEHSHDIIVLLDAEATVVYTSPAFRRQMGYEEWEILGQSFADFVHGEDRDALGSMFKELLCLAASGPFEFRFRRNDGEWRVFEAMATNLLRNAMVQSLVLNIRDMTGHKLAETELQKYRMHLEELVVQRTREVEEAHRQAALVMAASPDALIALDNEGYITFISQHYRLMYPDSAKTLRPGRHISQAFETVVKELRLSPLDPRHDDMREWWLNPRGSKEFRMQNGTWVRLQARRMADGSGTVISSTNISDYKRQQALLAQQSVELAAALEKERNVVEQQKTFVSMVSHEFRTPLTIIDGNAQIIERRGTSLAKEVLEKRAGTIRSAVERLVRLIETILSSHMMEIGKIELCRAPCDLEKLLRDTVADQQDISPAHKIRLDIRHLPASMEIDEKVIRQTLTNLLSNAVKYSPQGKFVDVSAFPENDTVIIEVKDEGIGIPEEEMPKIFTRYFRASTSGGIPGSGLGLNLVKHFVEMHNGQVALRSKVGIGTVVTVSLPIGKEG